MTALATPTDTISGSQAIAAILRTEGTEFLFTFPDNSIIDPCAEVGIRPLQSRTERTAVAMADGYTRASAGEKVGVVAVQFGPGIENTFGGVAQAFSDSTPLLILTGDWPMARIGQPPEFDPVVAFAPITKWAGRVYTADDLPRALRRAFSYLRSGRPGPVLLDIPAEVAQARINLEVVRGYQRVPRPRSVPSPGDVSGAVDALLGAKAPVLHAGQGVLYAKATPQLVEVAELLCAPVMTTLTGKGAFPEDHPLALGSGGFAYPLTVRRALERSDLIFGVGSSLTTTLYGAPIPEGRRIVQLTVDERDVQKDLLVHDVLIGDAQLGLRAMIDELKRRKVSPDSARRAAEAAIQADREEADRRWRPFLESDEIPISPYRVIHDVMRVVNPRETVVTHDAGRPRDQLSVFWQATVPQSYLGWGKSTHLGWGLGLIMGAKLALPQRTAINFMGDAAIGMVGMELETAARLRIPTITVVLNNFSMSNYHKRYPIANERYGFKELGGNYAGVAEALGATGIRVETPDGIADAVRAALAANDAGRPALIEVLTKEEAEISK